MTIDDLRALIDGADGDCQVYVFVEDYGHRDADAEIDADGDLIIKALYR